MECRGGLVYLGDLLYRIKSGFRLSKCDLGLCFHVHCVVLCVVLWCEAAAVKDGQDSFMPSHQLSHQEVESISPPVPTLTPGLAWDSFDH